MKRGTATWEEYQVQEQQLVEANSTTRWYQYVLDHIPFWVNDEKGLVLEIGAGPNGGFRMLLKCIGYDSVDPCWGDQFSSYGDLRISAESLPMPRETYDLAIISNALDHCEHPKAVAREIVRVTKRGGAILTGHYINQPDAHPWSFESAKEIWKLFRGARRRFVRTIESTGRADYTVVWMEKK